MSETDLIERLMTLWTDIAPNRVKVNHCIIGTRVAIEVGSYFGFRWEPLAVDIAVFNEPGLDLFLQHIPASDWPPEAHSVGCFCENELGETGWSGHVIVQTTEQLFDLSGAQFHRPDRDITIDCPWAMPKPTSGDGWLVRQNGLIMALWPRPDISVYRRTKDWRRSYQPIAAELIRTLKTTETEKT